MSKDLIKWRLPKIRNRVGINLKTKHDDATRN